MGSGTGGQSGTQGEGGSWTSGMGTPGTFAAHSPVRTPGGISVRDGSCWNGSSSIELTAWHIGLAGAEQHWRGGKLILVGASA